MDDCGLPYRFEFRESHHAPWQADPAAVVRAAAQDVLAGVPAEIVAARFHHAVVELVVGCARRLRDLHDLHTVALSGGVFLNAVLTVRCAQVLAAHGFRVLQHRLVPPSDAGLALGQVVVGARTTARGQACV
jgi:hydrogenase maturation protein HypF